MTEKYTTLIYGRTSKDDRRKLTIENQKAQLGRWLAVDDGVKAVAGEFWDAGVSGKVPFFERPGARKLLETIQANRGQQFALAVVYVDRFARDTLSGLTVAKELTELNTQLVCINEGLDARREASPMMFQLRLVIAEEEWRRIRERTTEGRRRAMDRDGAPPCCFLAFGYRLAANGQWQIDPVEGPIVQRMFAMAEEGCSNREIQAWLDSLPGLRAGRRFARRAERQTLIVRGQEDARWAKSTVARLLASRTYCGARQFAGRTFAVPALVSEEQWARVQAIRSGAAGHMRQRAGLPPAGFLSGLLRCGLCGGTIHADLKLINSGDKAPPANARYRCEGITTTPRACRLRQFRCWALDDQVWPALEAFVRDPGELLRRAIRQGGEQEQSLDDLVGREQEAGGQLAGLEGQIADVWEMQRRNNWPLSHVEAGIRQLHEQQDKLRLLLEHLRIEKGKLQAERDGVDALAANLASLGTLADAARGDYGLRGKIARMLIAKGVVVSEGPGRKAPIDVRLSLRWGETVTVAAAEVGNGSHRRPGLPQTGQTQPGAPMTLPLQFRVLSRGKCQRVG